MAKATPIDIANESLWQSRFGDPAKVAEGALKILKKAEKTDYQRGVAYANLNIAAAYFYQSRNDIALKHLSESFHWFEKNKNEKGYVRALLLKGNIHESFGDYDKTLLLWLEAFKSSVTINDRECEGESCSQLGLIYSRLCNFTKSLEYFNKGLKIREELLDENGAASSLNRIGMVLRQMKKYDESLEFYFRSLAIRERNNLFSAIPWTMLGIASTYEEMNDHPAALGYYEKGMTGGDRRCTLQCMMGMGRINSLAGKLPEAERQLKDSLELARELKAQSLIAEAAAALASHYESAGDALKALEYHKLYHKTRESVQSEEAQSRFRNIEISHAVEKSEQEKEIYRLRHVELKKAYDLIEEKNRDITASINYASRIQQALLPDMAEISDLGKKCFVFLLPRDIVSGDFYWFTEVSGILVIAAGDCTGHGVPGALMSMLGISFLEEIVTNRKITDPGLILNNLRREVQRALRQKGEKEEAKDGMDLALCSIDMAAGTLWYSGAYNNLYLVRNGELTEYPADRMPVSISDRSEKEFTTHEIKISRGDIFYMFSDGYADQFGGPDNKKFKYTTFKNLLLGIHRLPLKQQKTRLEREFLKWKGSNPQTDDVVVIGFRV
ncbi:MAG: tetratricopeptide repeat protein [Bacteroidales bacterium]|nr:tetratricopeptide repeat protein [Bacteroidales bacterium]